jgi:hypothetical protein
MYSGEPLSRNSSTLVATLYGTSCEYSSNTDSRISSATKNLTGCDETSSSG